MKHIFLLLIAVGFAACSSKKPAPMKTEDLLIYNLKWRHTQSLKEYEDVAEAPESKEVYCEEPHHTLNQKLNLTEMLKCIRDVKEPLKLNYVWLREDQPMWSLDLNSNQSECIQKHFAKIPLPREIFFESVSQNNPKKLDCYSQHLPLEKSKFLDSKLPFYKMSLQVDLPLENPPETTSQLETYLMSWVLSVFWSKEQAGFTPVGVPDRLCAICLGPAEKRPKHRFYWPKWPPK